MSYSNLQKAIALSVGVLAMVFSISLIVQAWTEPGVAPSGGNVPASINVSSTSQIKEGDLTIKTFIYGDDLRLGNWGGTVTNAGDIEVKNAAGTTTLFRVSGGDVNWSGSLTAGSVPWARLTSFPTGCAVGYAVRVIGTALTCDLVMANPMTTLGDIIYGGTGGAATRLAGSAGFLKSTGAVAPSWSAVNLGTADVTGTLAVSKGGTGLASYAVGDILYASAASTLSKLPIGTAGYVLQVSGGLPSWQPAAAGAPVGATYITQTPNTTLTAEQALSTLATGILKVTTGTGVISSLTGTTNYIPKWSDSGTLSGTSNIYDTGTNIGIGTTVPNAKLAVGGTGSVGDAIAAYANSANSALYAQQLGTGYAGYFSGKVSISTTGGTAPLAVTSNTKVANLNADFLDGFDSSAFGDATAANQTTIFNRIGQATDAASMDTTLFAGQQAIYNQVDSTYSACMEGGDGGGNYCNCFQLSCPASWNKVGCWAGSKWILPGGSGGENDYGCKLVCCLPR